MRFLDANIIIRYITGDMPEVLDRCTALFQRLHDGDEQVSTVESVVAEVVYVLASPKLYRLTGAEIAERLKPLLLLRGIQLPHKQTTCEALDLYAANKGLDFADALEIAHMQRLGIAEIYSYDQHFDRFQTQVRRVEP
jgi:predicted nucleic acid-binding protein